MTTRLIARGVLAGAVGGLVAFVFTRIGAEPIVGHVINIAGVRTQAPSAVDEHNAELLSPSGQTTGELAFVVVAFGAAMGALLAAAFAITYVRIDSVRPGALALLLAGDAFAALSLVPSLRYRPALGCEDIISQRTGLYLLMVGLSVALLIGAVTLGRRIPDDWAPATPPSSAPVCTRQGSLRRCSCCRRLTRLQAGVRATTAMPSCGVTWERNWCYGPLSRWFSRGLRTRSSMPRPIGIFGCKPDGPRGDSAAPMTASHPRLSPVPRISGRPLGLARVGADHSVARGVTYR